VRGVNAYYTRKPRAMDLCKTNLRAIASEGYVCEESAHKRRMCAIDLYNLYAKD
jgi:hypothetical protein